MTSPARVVLLCNGEAGVQVAHFLRAHPGSEVVALVLNAPDKQRQAHHILSALDLPAERVFQGERISEPEVVERLAELRPAWALSVYFGHILRPAFLELFPDHCVNLHPSYLPFGRGAHPAVWSIVEGTPAGATLHRIDAGIDTGAILSQVRVAVEPTDTGGSLYRKAQEAGISLLRDVWDDVLADRLSPQPQDPSAGTTHRAADLGSLKELDGAAVMSVQRALDLLRARTFSETDTAVVTRTDGTRVGVSMSLSTAAGTT